MLLMEAVASKFSGTRSFKSLRSAEQEDDYWHKCESSALQTHGDTDFYEKKNEYTS